MNRLEFICDTCKRTTTMLIEPGHIDYWGAGDAQNFNLDGLRMPSLWNYYFDVQLTCRLACSHACVRAPEEPHPHG